MSASDPRKRWEEEFAKSRLRDDPERFITVSGEEVPAIRGPEDVPIDHDRDLGYPGQFPFTRGIHPTLYRGKLWTMRQFAGFGTARDTNARYKYLLANGQTGLSVAFDLPTLMGYDSDATFAEGEVGKCGVAVASLDDMMVLFDGIPMGEVSTSMTINGPAAVLWAFYIAAAQARGVPSTALRGTVQNDILKEYIAQKEFIFPPHPSMRIITDMMAFGAAEVPQWNTISISGYHIREAGSTAVQELAFTLADGFAYVEAGIAAGMDVDTFAPRLSHFFNSHLDFFEEIAKYRAARRIWAKRMRDKYGAKSPRSWVLRFHTQTAGCSLTEQQPENNIVRTAFQAMAAVLGGTQSLHTNSMDETLALPSEKAVKIALRTQQVLAHETGVPYVMDPLGGSWYVEWLTNRMEEEAEKYFRKIDELGGVIRGIEEGFFQREIARSAYEYQKALEKEERVVVGVNRFKEADEKLEIPLLYIDESAEVEQRKRLAALRARRGDVGGVLSAIRAAARGSANLMVPLIAAAKAGATLGEIVTALKDVFGEYREPAEF
ncbi:MAG: methylmalonyl-CoA mutase family protein [Planctomycetes bacterium]|jgi:methylmalonyl-CoA mutase N-terminal domain/subunit|nr:methylmalonyl-CoA mutase family protein [Planctomycetota bacterium]